MVFIVEGDSLQMCPVSSHPSLTLQATPSQPLPAPLFTTATQPLVPRTTIYSGVASRATSSPQRTVTTALPILENRFEVMPQTHHPSIASPSPHSAGNYTLTSPASPSEASFEATSPAPQSEASYASPTQQHERPSMTLSPTLHSESSYVVTSPTAHSEVSYEW